jgi:alkyl hydroperoxide reductase subunit AhpF
MTPEQIVYLISLACCAIYSFNRGLKTGASAMVSELTDSKVLSKNDLEKFINIKAEEL